MPICHAADPPPPPRCRAGRTAAARAFCWRFGPKLIPNQVPLHRHGVDTAGLTRRPKDRCIPHLHPRRLQPPKPSVGPAERGAAEVKSVDEPDQAGYAAAWAVTAGEPVTDVEPGHTKEHCQGPLAALQAILQPSEHSNTVAGCRSIQARNGFKAPLTADPGSCPKSA